MDGVSGAASVVALIDFSLKVYGLCHRYYTEVKGAKDDIKHLLEEIDSFKVVLESGRDRLEGAQLHPDGSKLDDALTRAHSQLEKLQAKLQDNLDGGKRQKAMRRLGIRALKWPFESKEINSIIAQLKTCQDTLSAALVIDSKYVARNTFPPAPLYLRANGIFAVRKLPASDKTNFYQDYPSQ